MIRKRPFLQWFLLLLAYATLGFFTFLFGIPQAVLHTDVSYMTSVIAATFVVSALYLGVASWRLDPQAIDKRALGSALAIKSMLDRAHADSAIGRTAAFLVTLLGLLGTAIGLMLQVKAMGTVDVANSASVVAFIGTIGSALSTALYATACGIIACIGITVMNSNLEYFIDRES